MIQSSICKRKRQFRERWRELVSDTLQSGELSPSAAKAVLMHLRVRAILSKEEEGAILQYLAPGDSSQ